MGWLSVLLIIVQAIPAIIKIVEMVRDLLKNRTEEEKAAYAGELRGILKRWREHRNAQVTTKEMEGLLVKLKETA